MRRRSAKVIRLVAGAAGADPVQCFCGSVRWRYEFASFPMSHAAICEGCGRTVTCELRPTKPRPTPKPPEGPIGYQGFPPFWY